MPPKTSTSPQPPPGASRTFLRVIIANPYILRELLEIWGAFLADPETPEAEIQRIMEHVDFIIWGLTEELETVRRRIRVMEAEERGDRLSSGMEIEA
ncbi:hypothetical protein HOY82DRAFT_600346 [Tuber indicum]|nr:hypothetical protein HOY82DRAFT_600346 [Tuber indicum]